MKRRKFWSPFCIQARMLQTVRARRGMVTSPHHAASQAGLAILRQGGTAIEAAVATAATLAVVYPHMNAIGGDSFWLLHAPGNQPVAIEGCGAAGAQATRAAYQDVAALPWRGPRAAITVAGTVSAWDEALAINQAWGGRLEPPALLADAIHYAAHGIPVGQGHVRTVAAKLPELRDCTGFADVFLPRAAPLPVGGILHQPALATTLRHLAQDGLDSFYRGQLAQTIAEDLARCGIGLTQADLAAHHAARPIPLHVDLAQGRVFNLPPPTQGLASLLILAVFERLHIQQSDGFAHLHGLIEATKRAFAVRDREIGDPAFMTLDTQALLDDTEAHQAWANEIAIAANATGWQRAAAGGDTVWFGAVDAEGRAASVIQSTYFEFGCGIVLPRTGIIWQNRGASFSLDPGSRNVLAPGRKPFHTLNPALAHFHDGRVMAYGTMGGDGQPQTQAAIFTRYAMFGQDLQHAITAPRWLLGRTWGDHSTSLKLEQRFGPGLAAKLTQAGHTVELVPDFTDLMGHAGALVWHPGTAGGSFIEGACDPRSDGVAAAW